MLHAWCCIAPLSVSGCCRGSGLASGGEPLARRQARSRAPAPSACGTAYSFAGRGISVDCLATYKAREIGAYLLQKGTDCKVYEIKGLPSACWSGRLDCRIKWDADGGPRFGPAHVRHRPQPDSAALACLPTGNLRIGDQPPGTSKTSQVFRTAPIELETH